MLDLRLWAIYNSENSWGHRAKGNEPNRAQIEVFGYFLIEHEVSAHFLEFASIDVSDLALW